jgi:hypothetical protein
MHEIPRSIPAITADTATVTRGVRRWLARQRIASVTELILGDRRRADVFGIDPAGRITLVEIKVSVADFRSDRKWPNYEAFCDAFYFAVPEGFPHELVPDRCGLIVADGFDAECLRPAAAAALPPARRRALTLAFAAVAASRLHRLQDPGAAATEWAVDI